MTLKETIKGCVHECFHDLQADWRIWAIIAIVGVGIWARFHFFW